METSRLYVDACLKLFLFHLAISENIPTFVFAFDEKHTISEFDCCR